MLFSALKEAFCSLMTIVTNDGLPLSLLLLWQLLSLLVIADLQAGYHGVPTVAPLLKVAGKQFRFRVKLRKEVKFSPFRCTVCRNQICRISLISRSQLKIGNICLATLLILRMVSSLEL